MRHVALAALLVFLTLGNQPVLAAPRSEACPYQGGFAELHAWLGPEMGEPTTCEYPDPAGTGDVQQNTTRGLAYWRRSTNTPAFTTDGTQHWALTAEGPVAWLGQSVDPPSGTCVTPDGAWRIDCPEPLVLFLSGLDSRLRNPYWEALSTALAQQGIPAAQQAEFSYAGTNPGPNSLPIPRPYGLQDTCQSIAESTRKLDQALTAYRDSGHVSSVTLVGHSLGGLVALESATGTLLLSQPPPPFVSTVVVVDAPIEGGIIGWSTLFYANCPSLNQMLQRQTAREAIRQDLTARVQDAQNRGVNFLVVNNTADRLVNVNAQCVCGIPTINRTGTYPGPNNGHAGALYNQAAISEIADWIRQSVNGRSASR